MLYRASLKSQLMQRMSYGFASKPYDVAIIGGGPGGNSSLTQDTLRLSRPLSWALGPSALKSAVVLVVPALTLGVSLRRLY
jgi:hypothetical protein